MSATLTLGNDMRVGAIGRTRSGKTLLMRAILANQPRVLVIDDKARATFPGYHLTENPSAALLEPKTILRPNGKLSSNFWESAMEIMHNAGGGIIYIDELAEQCDSHRMEKGLRSIFRMGGELGVGCYWSAQSATEISNTAIRGSDVLLLFLNIGASDRDKVMRTTGDIAEATAHLSLYEFVVYESANQAYDPQHIPAYKLNLQTQQLATA